MAPDSAVPSRELDSFELAVWGDLECPFSASPEDHASVAAAHRRLMLHVNEGGRRIYGLHTGYGANVDSLRDPEQWRTHQSDLLTYLAVGVGEPFSDRVVRRALRLQAWKVAQGLSGIHPATYSALIELSARPILPRVPSYGSLGASGDLVPMAHAVAPLFETEAPRGPRDVIGLVNTNAMMSSLALECLDEVRAQWQRTVTVTAAASLALGVPDEPFDPKVLSLNSRQTQITRAGAAIVNARQRLLDGMGCRERPRNEVVQERYSIRCAPQVLGNLLENVNFTDQRILAEALSVADNPLVLDDGMWHGGLFYASGLASAADLMTDAAVRIGELVDRQVLLLVGADTNHGLPENLTSPGALHVKGIHQLLSSLNQGLRAGGVPSRNLSFSCEGNNQDVVPCGMVALVQLQRLLELSRQALRAASFCAERAVRLRYGRPLPDYLHLGAWPTYEPA